jgi:hypothetical protein
MGFVVGVQICSSPDYPIFDQRLSRNHALVPALPARRQKEHMELVGLPTFRTASGDGTMARPIKVVTADKGVAC